MTNRLKIRGIDEQLPIGTVCYIDEDTSRDVIIWVVVSIDKILVIADNTHSRSLVGTVLDLDTSSGHWGIGWKFIKP
jgi:hypothetical protein